MTDKQVPDPIRYGRMRNGIDIRGATSEALDAAAAVFADTVRRFKASGLELAGCIDAVASEPEEIETIGAAVRDDNGRVLAVLARHLDPELKALLSLSGDGAVVQKEQTRRLAALRRVAAERSR